MPNTAHTNVSPSVAYRAIQCPRSVNKYEAHSIVSGPYAQRGTDLHDALQYLVCEKTPPDDVMGKLVSADRSLVKRHALTLRKSLRELVKGHPCDIVSEISVRCDTSDDPWMKGSIDVCAICPELETIFLVDYKSGRTPTHGSGGIQLLLYKKLFEITYPNDVRDYKVRVFIYQPTLSYAPRFFEIFEKKDSMIVGITTADDAFNASYLVHQMVETEDEGIKVSNPGKHCTFCSNMVCPHSSAKTAVDKERRKIQKVIKTDSTELDALLTQIEIATKDSANKRAALTKADTVKRLLVDSLKKRLPKDPQGHMYISDDVKDSLDGTNLKVAVTRRVVGWKQGLDIKEKMEYNPQGDWPCPTASSSEGQSLIKGGFLQVLTNVSVSMSKKR